MDESMKSDEQGLDEMTEALIETGEAQGSGTSEEVAEVSSEENKDEGSDVASAKSETEDEVSEEVSSDTVSEEVVPLAVVLTFDEETVGLDVTDSFQIDFRDLCNEMNGRPDSYEVVGNTPLAVTFARILNKACK
ncbi:MAG: hypothetical protein ACXABJ_11130 [Candidatus Heimdallarchaeaceae archaeon]|jgi:hypothetical protein